MAKSAKKQAKKVAKTGAKQVGNVMAEALGAAAATAAGVVLTRVAEGMSSGAKKVEEENSCSEKRRKTDRGKAGCEKNTGSKKESDKKEPRQALIGLPMRGPRCDRRNSTPETALAKPGKGSLPLRYGRSMEASARHRVGASPF